MPRRRFAIFTSNGSGARPSAIDLTSPPTQKEPPAPLNSTARTSGSSAARRAATTSPADHVRVERVLTLGPVHRDGEQPAFELLQDHVIHGASPSSCFV